VELGREPARGKAVSQLCTCAQAPRQADSNLHGGPG